MSFDIHGFSQSCIGTLAGECTIARVVTAPESELTMLFDFGLKDPNGVPSNGNDGDGVSDFEATWFPEARILSIRTALSPLHFEAETVEDAHWILHAVNALECRVSSLSLVYTGEDERGSDEALDELDTFIAQASFPVPEAFDDPQHWPLLGAMFKRAVERLFTELADSKRMIVTVVTGEESSDVSDDVTWQ